jgi:hypothetical protein
MPDIRVTPAWVSKFVIAYASVGITKYVPPHARNVRSVIYAPRFGACTNVPLLFGNSVGAQAPNLFFVPPTFPGTGQAVTADLNGDGKADLVFADGTVLLGNADGTLHTGTPWSITGQSLGSHVAISDFNHDGKPDLLFVGQNSLFVLLGKGDGTFQTAVSTTTGTEAGQFFVADVNGDAEPDILLMSGSTLLVLLGKGDGTFVSPTLGPTLSGGWLGVGDFNGDGKIDLLVNPTAGQVGVLLGKGDGTFQSTPIITSAPEIGTAVVVTMGDVNRDGHLDCVGIFNTGGNGFQSFVLLGNGDGTFSATRIGSGALGAALGDVNGDGTLDLVSVANSSAQVFLGNGDGTFSPGETYFAQGSATAVLADFNGDGKLDIAANQPNSLLLGNGDGSFQGNFASPANAGVGAVAADFNQDQKADIGTLYISSLGTYVQVALGDGTGKFPNVNSFQVSPDFAYYSAMIGTADVNGDGKPDLLVATNTGTWTVYVMIGNGDGTFGAPIVAGQGPGIAVHYPFSMVVQDFNGDHKPDVAVVNYSGTVTVLLGKGDGTFTAGVPAFGGGQATSLVAADFNDDGKIDILVAGTESGLGLLLGKGDGTFEPVAFVNPGITSVTATADLNGDGAADLIAGQESLIGFDNPGPNILLGNGDGTFRLLAYQFPLPPVTAASSVLSTVVDINGDGKPDLVGTGYLGVEYALGNGDGTFGDIVAADGLGSPANFVAVADVNDDKRPDILFGVSGALVSLPNIGPVPAADFVINASLVSPALVSPGKSETSTVTVTALGRFGGSVTLSCGSLPVGVSCNFSPSSISGAGSSALTISTTSSTPLGSYPISVAGSATALTHTTVLTLTMASSAGVTTAAMAPNSLAFVTQAVGTTSTAQSVVLTNTGISQSMAITGVSIQGQNPGDFAISGNIICPGFVLSPPSTLAAGGSCQFSITFTPSSGGARTASLAVSDNATASPQIVALAGNAPDFSWTTNTPTSITVTAGQQATYSIALAPSAGFNQTITVGCTGAPALSTCSVSPSQVTLNGIASTNVTVTIATTAKTLSACAGIPPPSVQMRPTTYRGTSFFVLTLAVMIPTLALGFVIRQKGTLWRPAFSSVILISASVVLVSCGGGSSTTSGGNPGTPPGKYTISVSGSAGSASTSTTHSVNLTLVVQ